MRAIQATNRCTYRHRDAQHRAVHVEEREDRIVEEQHAQHAERDEALSLAVTHGLSPNPF